MLVKGVPDNEAADSAVTHMEISFACIYFYLV